MSVRRVAELVTVLGVVSFVGLAALLVPWTPLNGGGIPAPAEASSVFTAAQVERGEDYSGTARALGWSSLAVSTGVALLLGLTPLGAGLLGRRRGRWPLTVVVLVVAVLLAGRLATLPFAIVSQHRRRDHGLSNQDWLPWALDQVRGLGVSVVMIGLTLLVLVGCARRWPRWWPAVAGVVASGLVVLGSFLYPLLVEPVFNSFEPLEEGPLRTQILEVAEAEGIRVDDVLVADASRRTTTLNAYVSGFGETRRVVLYDTLVESLPPDQALSVVAHELAHAQNDDVVIGTLLGACAAFLGVGLLALVTDHRSVRRRAGVAGLADPRCVALVLALTSLAGLAAAPVQNAVSRRIETRADVEALKATGDPVAFVEMQKRLCLRSLCDPAPPDWAHVWFGSHPTVLERVALARQELR